MAALWLLLELIMTFLYYDLPTVKNDVDDHSTNDEQHRYDNSVQNYSSTERNIANNSINVDATENEHIVSGDMIRDLYSKHSSIIDSRRQNLINSATQDFQKHARNEPVMDKWHLAKDLVREEVIVILASQFLMFFNQTALEAIVTPLSEYLMGWKELENSIAYCLIALEAILVFALVRKLSRKLADRWLMVIGIAFEGFALVWYLFLLANAKPYDSIVLPTIIVGTLVIVFGLPFFSVANISLYSKITDEKTQGIAQGIQRSVTGVAMILGPLWGGALTTRLFIMLGVMAGLEVILAILMYLSFHRLKEPSKQLPSQYDQIGSQSERQPLLG